MNTAVNRAIAKKNKKIIEKSILYFNSAENDSTIHVSHHVNKSLVGDGFDILFLHGALAYAEREESFFNLLFEANLKIKNVFAPDLSGHGKSSGPRSYISDFDHYLDDFFNLLNLKIEYSKNPYFIVAHSLGGLIALYAFLEKEKNWKQLPAGIILINPCIKPLELISFPYAHDVLAQIAKYLPHLRFPRIMKGSDLTNDDLEANRFETDPMISHFMTASMAHEINRSCAEIRSMPYFIDVPCFFLLAENDLVVDRQTTELFIRAMDKKFVEVKYYKNSKHELLHDLDKDQAITDIVNWIKQQQRKIPNE